MSQATGEPALSGLFAFLSAEPQSGAESIDQILNVARLHLGMDVAFVSEFVSGQRVFRHVDSARIETLIRVGQASPLEEGYCQRVVDGRLPELIPDTSAVPEAMRLQVTSELPVGAHLSVPIRLREGRVYGTFCCFRHAADPSLNERDLDILRAFAQLTASRVDQEIESTRTRQETLARFKSAMREQQLEALGHLTGGVAHDFNNLLAVILGNAEILHEECTDPELKDTATIIMTTAEKGADLAHRLLAFGRRQALHLERIDVGKEIRFLSDEISNTGSDQVKIELQLSGALHVDVDRSLFYSAIRNLVLNAREAMPDGGTLFIATALMDASEGSPPNVLPGNYVRITVGDTGVGMTEDVLQRAFDPFFTTKDVGKGSGMGLPMVYGFAKQSGGDVMAESKPGHGTSVHLLLPLATADASTDEAPCGRAINGQPTILLVEDDPHVRKFVSSQISALGYSVIEAEDGKAAVSVLNAHGEIDLLFTDVILPNGISGYDLIEFAREHRADLKVLLTTGYAPEPERSAKDIAAPILRKPYRKQQLATALRSALGGRAAQSSTPGTGAGAL